MKTLTGDQVKELRGKGVKVTTEDGKHFFARPTRKPEVKPEPPPETPKPNEDHHKNMQAMLSIMGASEANMNGIIETNKAVAAVLLEMAKPKPKKSFSSTVNRGTDGKIKTVLTKEL